MKAGNPMCKVGGRKCDYMIREPLESSVTKIPFEGKLGELPCLRSAQDPNLLCESNVSHADQGDLR